MDAEDYSQIYKEYGIPLENVRYIDIAKVVAAWNSGESLIKRILLRFGFGKLEDLLQGLANKDQNADRAYSTFFMLSREL